MSVCSVLLPCAFRALYDYEAYVVIVSVFRKGRISLDGSWTSLDSIAQNAMHDLIFERQRERSMSSKKVLAKFTSVPSVPSN